MGQSTLGVLALVVGVLGALVALFARPTGVRFSGVALLVLGIVIVGAAVHTPAVKQAPIVPIVPAGIGLTTAPTPNASPLFSPLALPSSFHSASPSPTPSHSPSSTPSRTPAPGPTRP